MYTTVLFDLDDTLFDHLATARAALAATCAEHPALRAADQLALSTRYGELLEELHPQLLAGRYTVVQARQLRFERLLAPYGLAPAAAHEVGRGHYAHYQRLRRPLAGARELLQALRPRCRIGIVTNNRQVEQEDKLQHLGLATYIDVLLTSEAVGVAKPDSRIYTVALERLGATSATTLMVGDNWVADVLGALAVGIRPIWLNRTGRPAPQPQVPHLTSLEPTAAVLAYFVRVASQPLPLSEGAATTH